MKLRGQGAAYREALEQARRLRLHHGLLIEGARGIGKSCAAVELAQALLCESAAMDRGCGTCGSCCSVASGNHPDLHRVVVAEDKHDISVGQVRELQVILGRRVFAGRARVALLDPADRLTEQAQNALLKTLEEPGDHTYLLLPTTRPEGMLSTVRSRAGRLRLRALAEKELFSVLEDCQVGDAHSRSIAAGLASGSVGLARQLIEQGITVGHQQLVDLFERPADISAVALSRALLEGASGRAEAGQRARLQLSCARAWLRTHRLGSLAQQAEASYPALELAPWADVFEILFEAEADLDLRLGAEQVLCSAFLRVQQQLVRAI